MKILKALSTLTLFSVLLFYGCKKDDLSVDPIPEDMGELVKGSVSGIVIDENDETLADVNITLGPHSTFSDENGYFTFNNVEINTKGSLLAAHKEGFYYNAKFIKGKVDKRNYTKIKLLQKELTGSFTASASATITTDDRASIQFPANGINNQNGNLHAGNVNVYAKWLDPTANDLAQIMPGDLRASNTANEQVQLATYGMLGVELEDDSGNSLNIANGKTATITLPVPAALLSTAPSTIPLWHFDEVSGFWKEEGEATLEGNQYVGTVGHFSFWNVDIPFDFIYLQGNITDHNENGVQNLQVQIKDVATGMVGYDWTNQNGVFQGYVPMDSDLAISIVDECGDEIYDAPIGPFGEDTTLPSIMLSGSSSFITVTGNLVCDMNPVTNGYVNLTFNSGESSNLSVDDDGHFNATISICDATNVNATGFDVANFNLSAPCTHYLDNTNLLDLGTISVCNESQEFLSFTVNAENYTSFVPTAIIDSTGALIIEIDNNGTHSFTLKVQASEPGEDYTPLEASMQGTNLSTGDNFGVGCFGSGCSEVTVDIDAFGEIGAFIIGSFEGHIIGMQYAVSGSFKVLRE